MLLYVIKKPEWRLCNGCDFEDQPVVEIFTHIEKALESFYAKSLENADFIQHHSSKAMVQQSKSFEEYLSNSRLPPHMSPAYYSFNPSKCYFLEIWTVDEESGSMTIDDGEKYRKLDTIRSYQAKSPLLKTKIDLLNSTDISF